MAHAGPNTGGSQFFIVHSRQATAHLDGLHTCFGKVTEGIELIPNIRQGDTFSVTIDEQYVVRNTIVCWHGIYRAIIHLRTSNEYRR